MEAVSGSTRFIAILIVLGSGTKWQGDWTQCDLSPADVGWPDHGADQEQSRTGSARKDSLLISTSLYVGRRLRRGLKPTEDGSGDHACCVLGENR